jgi:hypothetical protein
MVGHDNFGGVQECYILRRSRTYWLPLPKNMEKNRTIADSNSKKEAGACVLLSGIGVATFNGAVAAGNK